MTNPKIILQIQGQNKIQDLNSVEELDSLKGERESEFYLLDTDGDQSINITGIGTIDKIMVISSNATLKITTASGDTDIPVSGTLFYGVDSTFAGTITGISISTANTAETSVQVRIYGTS